MKNNFEQSLRSKLSENFNLIYEYNLFESALGLDYIVVVLRRRGGLRSYKSINLCDYEVWQYQNSTKQTQIQNFHTFEEALNCYLQQLQTLFSRKDFKLSVKSRDEIKKMISSLSDDDVVYRTKNTLRKLIETLSDLLQMKGKLAVDFDSSLEDQLQYIRDRLLELRDPLGNITNLSQYRISYKQFLRLYQEWHFIKTNLTQDTNFDGRLQISKIPPEISTQIDYYFNLLFNYCEPVD